MAAPFNVPAQRPLLGGSDADLAVAPEPNTTGHYNIYAASLWVAFDIRGVGVGDISLALSPDDGATWVVHPLAAEVPLDDRPWLAADGACRVYLTYHAGPTVANVVNSYDLCDPAATVAGLTLAPVSSSRYPELAVPFLLQQRATYVTVGFGKPAVDTSPTSPFHHRLYVPMVDCPGLTPQQEIARAQAAEPNCPPGTNARVFVAVGTNGATHWDLRRVADSTTNEVAVWPATVAVDAAGRVYLAWHDNHHAWLQTSSNGGDHWSSPLLLNPTGTAVYPTVGASGDGHVLVAWYGTDVAGDANDPKAMGLPRAPGAATWRLYRVSSSDAGEHVSPPAVVDDSVHTGVLCTRGTSCTIANSRTLLDDFGIVVSPAAGGAVVYTSDQPGGGWSNDVTRWALVGG